MKRSSVIKRNIKFASYFLHSIIFSTFYKAKVRLYPAAPRDKEQCTNIFILIFPNHPANKHNISFLVHVPWPIVVLGHNQMEV